MRKDQCEDFLLCHRLNWLTPNSQCAGRFPRACMNSITFLRNAEGLSGIMRVCQTLFADSRPPIVCDTFWYYMTGRYLACTADLEHSLVKQAYYFAVCRCSFMLHTLTVCRMLSWPAPFCRFIMQLFFFFLCFQFCLCSNPSYSSSLFFHLCSKILDSSTALFVYRCLLLCNLPEKMSLWCYNRSK